MIGRVLGGPGRFPKAATGDSVKGSTHHVDVLDMMFSTASLAVVGLTLVGTVLNLYIMRRRARRYMATK